jgi:hypothetical protein
LKKGKIETGIDVGFTFGGYRHFSQQRRSQENGPGGGLVLTGGNVEGLQVTVNSFNVASWQVYPRAKREKELLSHTAV